MFDLIREAIGSLQMEAATYPDHVRLWMKVMAVSFFSGLIFAPWKTGARWFVAAILINIVGLIIGKILFPDATRSIIGTVIHLVFWTPVLWLVWSPTARKSRRANAPSAFNRIYAAWLIGVSTVMAVSLVLDAQALLAALL